MKNLQSFFRKHFEMIMLFLKFVTWIFLACLFLYVMQADREMIESIEEETDAQTVIINRQFQALCFLLVETSGERVLRELDPPLEEQCRTLAQDLREAERAAESKEQAETDQRNQPPQVAPTPSQRSTEPEEPRREPQPEPTRPETPQQPETPRAEPTLVDRLLDSLRLGGLL